MFTRAWIRCSFFCLFCILSTDAFGWLRIQNNTNETIHLCIGYCSNGNWYAEGWWNIEPGEDAIVVGGNLRKRYYYYYAHSKSLTWAGKYSFSIDPKKSFNLRDGNRTTTRLFREIDTGQHKNYTLELNYKNERGRTIMWLRDP